MRSSALPPRLPRRATLAPALGVVAVAASAWACSGAPPASHGEPQPAQALASMPRSAVGQIEVRTLDARPRLTLVSRDGDPIPAVAITVATDLGAAATTVLAAVVEARLRGGGFDVDVRVDRSAFRVRMLTPDPARVGQLFAAVAQAENLPITPGAPELALAAQRVESLRRNPLDADELAPVAACTGRLGVAPGEALPNIASAAGARDAEAWRRAALHAGRTSIAAVGPTPFCLSVAAALEQTAGWAPGPAAADAWPGGDTVGVYASPELDRRQARVTVAVRVGDAHAAVAAAERLGAIDSPLIGRLASLPEPWRAVEVTGAVRPRGGCVSVVVETERATSMALAPPAALVTALVRQEIRAELAGPSGQAVATRQILTAADPREAASRASWWALSGSVSGAPERWAMTLGAPATKETSMAVLGSSARPGQSSSPSAQDKALLDPLRAQLRSELDRAIPSIATTTGVEQRIAVERGQGELWVLLASPCGVAEEGGYDAGLTALAALTVVKARRRDADVAIEPWITADGIGVMAHAAFRDERETPAELARRVADTAAQALAGTTLSPEALAVARSASLEHLEQTGGRHATALEAFTTAIVPEHPSWLAPFGLWNRVASSGIDSVRLRWQAFAGGPLRVAVIANADPAQASIAADAVSRWILPRAGDRSCRVATSAAGRAGRVDVRLPRGTPLAQAIVGAAVPGEGAPGHDLAQLTALALDGSGGLLEVALGSAHLAARGSARIVGGSRAAALLIDVRAPGDSLADAIARVKELLARLAQTGFTEADAARALAATVARDAASRAEPRRRLVDLWSGRPPAAVIARPSPFALRSFVAGALRDDALVVVEARPE